LIHQVGLALSDTSDFVFLLIPFDYKRY